VKAPRWRRLRLAAALVGLAAGLPASAQILPSVGGVLDRLPAVGPTVDRTVDQTTGLADRALGPQALLDERARRLRDLVRSNARSLETDAAGNPVVRGEVLALSPTPQALAAARAAGFVALRQTSLDGLDLQAVVLAPPAGMSASAAMSRLRRLDPQGQYDLNQLYFPSDRAADGERAPPAGSSGAATDARVGLIDTGVDARLPVFAGVAIEQRGFSPGAPVGAAHGAATASLIAGRLGAFHGAAPGARLYVADIYGAGPTGGSAEALARALAWMAQVRAPVINVSLVGPPNALVAAAVRALSARGARVVAAVGNDGPAAPPAYPASYPEVIAVTAVDARDRVLPEAGRAAHIDYAAPGAEMSAAGPSGGLTAVRGTSFAAPIVAGRLAMLLREPNPTAAPSALAALDREARPAVRGAAGHGVIGEDVRLSPPRH
jgi:hypothetical protein